jgi:hypothetical protein
VESRPLHVAPAIRRPFDRKLDAVLFRNLPHRGATHAASVPGDLQRVRVRFQRRNDFPGFPLAGPSTLCCKRDALSFGDLPDRHRVHVTELPGDLQRVRVGLERRNDLGVSTCRKLLSLPPRFSGAFIPMTKPGRSLKSFASHNS